MTLRAVADILLVAGGLNWGTLAVTNGKTNPVEILTGKNHTLSNVVYGAVGVAAVYTVLDRVFYKKY